MRKQACTLPACTYLGSAAFFTSFPAFLLKYQTGIREKARRRVISVAHTHQETAAQACHRKQLLWDSSLTPSEIQQLWFRCKGKPLEPFKGTLRCWNANCAKLLILHFDRYTASGVYGFVLLPESPRSFGLGARPVSTKLVALLWIHKDPIFLWFKAFRRIFQRLLFYL